MDIIMRVIFLFNFHVDDAAALHLCIKTRAWEKNVGNLREFELAWRILDNREGKVNGKIAKYVIANSSIVSTTFH